MLLLVTHRTGGRDESVALGRLIRDLRQEHRAIAISLAPLAEGDFSEIVARTETLHDVPSGISPRVAALSHGNPLFAAQLLYGYVEGQTDPASDPHTVGEAIAARVERLDADARAIALVAAATGETFRTDFVAEVGGWGENAVLTAIATLVERRMVREAGAASFEYAFAHGLIRQTLYDTIPAGERAARHRRIAAVMSRAEGERLQRCRARRATGRSPETGSARAQAFERAARAAIEIYANAEAAAYARAAIDLADDDAERLRLHSILVRSRSLAAEIDAFRRDCDAFVDLARRLGDPRAQIESLKMRQTHQLHAGDRDGAARDDRRDDGGCKPVGRNGASHRRALRSRKSRTRSRPAERSRCDLPRSAAPGGRLRLARDDRFRTIQPDVHLHPSRQARRRGRAAGRAARVRRRAPASERIGVASTAAWLAHVREDFDDLLVQSHELLDLAQTIGDARREARAHLWLAYADHQELRVESARAHYRRCGELSERIGHLGELTTVALNLGTVDVEVGQAERALGHLERALELGKPNRREDAPGIRFNDAGPRFCDARPIRGSARFGARRSRLRRRDRRKGSDRIHHASISARSRSSTVRSNPASPT